MESNIKKPVVYIASPYSRGDAAINTHSQCRVFDKLLTEDLVTPIAPLWSHFQHTLFPRAYEDWIKYDQSLLHLYDACLRLDSEDPRTKYVETQSSGADNEVATFKSMGKPVFFSIPDLYSWIERNEK